ncbi:Gmad2 immunoglobulin-like domain-containing protein [Salinimicrobium xinjiangense]|uniref:Gmad2 immunoglobulin-like domain-containing protein n=1 Tax=Salinimicrobium xinjiangense TaxID=438596 RepID=UPI00041EAD4F|nr:Gmad2 immunoglobulin-like domain-containing protein [Salinimicrobium xinjiangense]
MSIIFISLLLFSCRNSAGSGEKEETTAAPEQDTTMTMETYTSQKWHFSTKIPEGFIVYEGNLPGEAPVINFYDRSIEQEPPFGIHNDASMAYIAVLPEGYGVDGPGGPRKSFKDWDSSLKLDFNIDPNESYAYLLESGEAWAVSLKFFSPPQVWNEYGGIYVFYEVNNFRAECFSANTGEEISMEECNALGGDAMKFYGDVSEEKKEALNAILENLYFTDPKRDREEIGDLVRVEQPRENAVVSSPLEIKGEAKGYWFFEASAPVELLDENGNRIAEKYITATNDWMTEDWVPFEGHLEFETKEKRGYLKFNRANASGKPEHDRTFRIPVVFN